MLGITPEQARAAHEAYNAFRRVCLTEGKFIPMWRHLSLTAQKEWVQQTPPEPVVTSDPVPPWMTGSDEPRGPRMTALHDADMGQRVRVTINREGELPITHTGILKGVEYPEEDTFTFSMRPAADPTDSPRVGDRATATVTPNPGAEGGPALHALVMELKEDVEHLSRTARAGIDSHAAHLDHLTAQQTKQAAQLETIKRALRAFGKGQQFADRAVNRIRRRVRALKEHAGYTQPRPKPDPRQMNISDLFRMAREPLPVNPALAALMGPGYWADRVFGRAASGVQADGNVKVNLNINGKEFAESVEPTAEQAERAYETLRGMAPGAMAPWSGLSVTHRAGIVTAVREGLLTPMEN